MQECRNARMQTMQEDKNAVIVSAPSGAGKTSIVKFLLGQIPDLAFSVSACSRQPRENEQNGKDYYFMTADEFRGKIARDEFVEWEEVYPDSFYGTLKSDLDRIWEANKIPIFDVDVIGGLNLKKYFGNNGLAIFIQPPTLGVLISRLQQRGTESAESLQKRISKAEYELKFAPEFDYILINDDIGLSCKKAIELVKSFLS